MRSTITMHPWTLSAVQGARWSYTFWNVVETGIEELNWSETKPKLKSELLVLKDHLSLKFRQRNYWGYLLTWSNVKGPVLCTLHTFYQFTIKTTGCYFDAMITTGKNTCIWRMFSWVVLESWYRRPPQAAWLQRRWRKQSCMRLLQT